MQTAPRVTVYLECENYNALTGFFSLITDTTLLR